MLAKLILSRLIKPFNIKQSPDEALEEDPLAAEKRKGEEMAKQFFLDSLKDLEKLPAICREFSKHYSYNEAGELIGEELSPRWEGFIDQFARSNFLDDLSVFKLFYELIRCVAQEDFNHTLLICIIGRTLPIQSGENGWDDSVRVMSRFDKKEEENAFFSFFEEEREIKAREDVLLGCESLKKILKELGYNDEAITNIIKTSNKPKSVPYLVYPPP